MQIAIVVGGIILIAVLVVWLASRRKSAGPASPKAAQYEPPKPVRSTRWKSAPPKGQPWAQPMAPIKGPGRITRPAPSAGEDDTNPPSGGES